MTLARLLDLEKERVKGLLHGVVEQEADREPFEIAAVELALDTGIAGLELSLRIDRVDRDSEGKNIVIDYKTGSPKRLLSREKEPKDMQLVVYAMALTGRIGGIALLNVDSRQISLDAAGYDFPAKVDWDHALPSWIEAVEAAAGQIARGDVRINVAQSIQASRPLGLLSRFRELQLEQ
jgi:RecB family exonuclease